ncbi:hypothetical protein Q8G28_15270 [Lysinibacillus capsici]|nr:hypothetical protein [Lysinibacillus capsici]MDP1394744.1 hypothetical protein [Lysinibacillus capsici]MDP1415195.1 hypothetical protein [Lysinibacillus capsici]MDP1431107.1 hypothetical protein [Lysinibacillus capsici]
MNKQLSIFDILEQPKKKASTNVNKPVDKKMYIEPRMRVYVVHK